MQPAKQIGQHIRLIIPPDRWPEEEDVLARIRRGKKVEHFETARRASDGRLLNLSLTVSPIRDAQGRVVGASKEAPHSDLCRASLSAITGWASLMHSGKLDREETARAAETILRNAQIQTQLISDLLDVSAIVSGRLRLNIRPSNLGSVVKAALEVVRPAAQAKSIHLEVSIEPAAHAVAGDPDRLQQVCWKLALQRHQVHSVWRDRSSSCVANWFVRGVRRFRQQ
jgi:signal transduction histidine kinase